MLYIGCNQRGLGFLSDKPKIAKWVATPHAIERMGERGISVADLESVLQFPDETTRQGPKWIFSKFIDGRTDNAIAAVVLEKKEHDLWVILTVMINFQKTR